MLSLLVLSPPEEPLREKEILLSLFAEGLETYHLRKPHYTEREMRLFISDIPSSFHSRIVLHSHWHLGEEYSLKGVHGSPSQGVLQAEPSFFSQTISQSIHHFSEYFQSAQNLNEAPDYVFLSPLFNSISKQGYHAKFKSEELELFFQERIFLPQAPQVIALGGIDSSRIIQVKQWGFDGVALLGCLWDQKTPQQALHEFIKIKNLC